ncbi:MAG: beta-lactamase-like protein [Rhodospirillales bacterium]|jgi:glyoxylase-like metal-dependent hydrolase (beta-lactamase superfamily II)|nr:beta-lactamase-like protein [Rhodospirillales bacterium]
MTLQTRRKWFRGTALAALTAALALAGDPALAQSSHPIFKEKWIAGTKNPEPEMQVQRVDADTFVIRQSVETNAEAPFLYLLFGTDRVLLEDTGAGGLMVKPTIDKVIAGWLAEKGRKSIPLVVAHSHSHGDHIAGDGEFAGDPNVTVVGLKPEDVAAFFKIKSWPTDIVAFDLGGRILNIIPTPGHEPAAIMIYDPKTRWLLSGDSLYPGRLYVKLGQFHTFRDSIDRVASFTKPLKVSWLMGTHIEMTTRPGEDYPIHTASHPNERALELPYSRLSDLQNSLDHMGEFPKLDVHGDFIFYPLP